MFAGGGRADAQQFRDAPVRMALRHQSQHFPLAGRQSEVAVLLAGWSGTRASRSASSTMSGS